MEKKEQSPWPPPLDRKQFHIAAPLQRVEACTNTPVDLKRPIITLLNKLIHDEYTNCTNCMALLAMLQQNGDPEIEKASASLQVILAALTARKAIYEQVASEYYKLRDALEAPTGLL